VRGEKGQRLTRWFALLSHFNEGKPLKKEMIREIEDFFEHFWQHDKRQALCSKEEKRILKQLPASVTRKIYIEYLYQDFLYTFRVYFRMSSPLLGLQA